MKEVGHGIKGALAGVHGLGEKIRGEFNSAVDEAAGDVSASFPLFLVAFLKYPVPFSVSRLELAAGVYCGVPLCGGDAGWLS